MSAIYKIIKNLDSVTRKFGGIYIASGSTYQFTDDIGLRVAQEDYSLISALMADPAEAAMISPEQNTIELTGTTGLLYLLNLDAPKNIDARPIQHSTPRRIGTYTYFASADDDHTDPHAVGGDNSSNISEIFWDHSVSGANPETIYLDFNTIYNETYVRQGGLMWKDADLDYVSFTITPKLTTYSSGSNTNYDLYGGFLIIPASPGTGSITVGDSDRVLVQNVPNEFGDLPAGYWDATWNPSTKTFDSITPNYTGEGEFNMFGVEILLNKFMNRKRLLGTGNVLCPTSDVSQLGHNMRLKLDVFTYGTDHAWKGCGTVMLYRKKTV